LNTVPLNVIKRAPLGATLAHERMFINMEQALEAYQQSMDQGTSNG
jgi:predicted metal-dependent phosphotriesterase family hydrolase